jgi:hypothetical protein
MIGVDAPALAIGGHVGLVVLEDGDHRVGGAEIDAYDRFAHGYLP